MAHDRHLDKHQRPVKAATLLVPRCPVVLGGTTGLLAIPVGTNNIEIFGITGAATHAAGEYAVVYEEGNVVKAVACASLGAGAKVDVGSTNERLKPAAAASGVVRYTSGISEGPASDGEVFSVYIKPRQTGGLA